MEDQSQTPKALKITTLLYHDVVESGQAESSGFPGLHAARYKLERQEFARHLAAINQAVACKPVTVLDSLHSTPSRRMWMLTFDDGGISAYFPIADMLEKYGWKAHFFVTAGFIGQPTFVGKHHIRELRRKGHVIGSHSSSHPLRISALSPEALAREWGTSVETLSDILGEQVTTASVPGGYYSRRVAHAAFQSGIRTLFTSEPVAKASAVEGLGLVFGRYTIWQGMQPGVSAGFVSGLRLPRYRQFLFWNSKKIAKMVGGRSYSRFVKYLLGRRSG
jgi:peptidoglycan/xylan/chitin deacetylase (PgdA/CDA1 family)